jgi:hypothetical protein
MSGGREFDAAKFAALTGYVHAEHEARSPHPMGAERLAWTLMFIDFRAYQEHGKAVTGATWCKGREHPECREMGEGWFERWSIAHAPWWARWTARALVAVAVLAGPRRA